jgi:flavin-dependent dehydrogenase
MSASVEVGIVGAGPVGARAAELLAGHGAGVVLLDPKSPGRSRAAGG